MIAPVLVAVAVLAAATLAQPPKSGELSFQGASLGMTRMAWLALPPPGPAGSHGRVTCWDAPHPMLAGRKPPPAAEVECTYARSYGRYTLPVTVTLPDGRRATRLRYLFVEGRLTRIAYRVSTDNYEVQAARLTAHYGPADSIRRDRVRTSNGLMPRVVQTWKRRNGTIELIDPVAPFSDLEVRMTSGSGKTPDKET